MPNTRNVESLAKISSELEGASALWVFENGGLTVKEFEELRHELTAAGAKTSVCKNTLIAKALQAAGMPEIDAILNGPSVFVFAQGDPVPAAKAIKDFADKSKKIAIKGGIMDGASYDAAEVEKIAALPSRDQLLGQIANSLTAVASQIAIAINGMAEKEAA